MFIEKGNILKKERVVGKKIVRMYVINRRGEVVLISASGGCSNTMSVK